MNDYIRQNTDLQDRTKTVETHYIACFHVSPSKLLTALAMLKTSDMNQNELTLKTFVSHFTKAVECWMRYSRITQFVPSVIETELQGRSRDGRKEGCYSAEIKEVVRSMLLGETNRRDTCKTLRTTRCIKMNERTNF